MGGTHPENPLQQARVTSGITQEQAAEALDCGTRTIQWYESGEQFPTQDVLISMAKEYNCSLEALFPAELTSPVSRGRKEM